MVTSKTKLIGLLGYPLEHTFAPRVHNETFKKLNKDYFYFPIEVKNDRLKDVINGLRYMNFAGFYVTKPNKVKVVELLDEVDDLAKKMNSVNCVVKIGNKLKGYNTDGLGFVLSLKKELKVEPENKKITIFGAGGAGRSISFALAVENPKEIVIIDKNHESSTKLVDDINNKVKPLAKMVRCNEEDYKGYVEKADIIINATGLGMYPDIEKTPIRKELLNKKTIVCDITYNPKKTQLLKDAENIGCKVMNGLGMGVNQGAKGVELLLNIEPPFDIMSEEMHKIVDNIV